MFWDICSKFCSKSSLFQEILSREKQNPEPSNHYGSRVPVWYARLDSNQRPSESESDALSNCATGAYQNSMNLWGISIFENSGQIVVNGGENFPLHWLEATDFNGLRRFAADRT